MLAVRAASGATTGEVSNLAMRRVYEEKLTRGGTYRASVRGGGVFGNEVRLAEEELQPLRGEADRRAGR